MAAKPCSWLRHPAEGRSEYRDTCVVTDISGDCRHSCHLQHSCRHLTAGKGSSNNCPHAWTGCMPLSGTQVRCKHWSLTSQRPEQRDRLCGNLCRAAAVPGAQDTWLVVPSCQAKCLAQQSPQQNKSSWRRETMVALASSLSLPVPGRSPAPDRPRHLAYLGTEKLICSNMRT